MARIFDRTGWILKGNLTQATWLKNYLLKRNIVIVDFTKEGTLESQLIETLKRLPATDAYKKEIQKIKGAWRTYRNRYERANKKEIQKSFILTTDSISQLQSLSLKLGQTINTTLDCIIKNEYRTLLLDKEKHKNERLKERQKRKEIKDYIEGEKLLLASPLRKLKGENYKINQKNKELEAELIELSSRYKAQLKLMSEFIVILDDNELLGHPLTKDQHEEANKHYSDLIQSLKR